MRSFVHLILCTCCVCSVNECLSFHFGGVILPFMIARVFSFFFFFFSYDSDSFAVASDGRRFQQMWCQLNEMCPIECVALILNFSRSLVSYFLRCCSFIHSLRPIKIDCDCVPFCVPVAHSLADRNGTNSLIYAEKQCTQRIDMRSFWETDSERRRERGDVNA